MDYIQQIKTEIFNITNEVRTGFKLKPLAYSTELERMGQMHTNEMYTHKFFLHDNVYCKKVETLFDRVNYCGLIGIFNLVGENLADYPTDDSLLIIKPNGQTMSNNCNPNLACATKLCRQIIKGWYNSPGHRTNLLCPEYDFVGFGLLLYPKVCYGIKKEYLLVTQNFGKTLN
jgi:uncharacterized protein YkwD